MHLSKLQRVIREKKTRREKEFIMIMLSVCFLNNLKITN